MPTREKQHVAAHRAYPSHYPISSRANLAGRFPARTTVAEQFPVWPLCMDLDGASSFVLTVVPFHQVAIGFGHCSKACQLTSQGCSLQRTHEYFGKSQFAESFAKPAGVAPPSVGQRQVGKTRVLPREALRGLPVPGQVNHGKLFAHDTPLRKSAFATSFQPPSEWPLPVRYVLGVDPELVRVVFTRYLLVEQSLPNRGSRDAEAGHPVACVDRQAEAIHLVSDGNLSQGALSTALSWKMLTHLM